MNKLSLPSERQFFARLMPVIALTTILLLAACGGQAASPTTAPDVPDTAQEATTSGVISGDNSPEVQTVQNYLTAKVSNNDERVRALLCAEREADFEMEASSFDAVTEARIENMACTLQSEGLVVCTGQIVATYGAEDLDFPLGAYNVVQEDGEWKWCGEAATDTPLPGSTAEAIGE
jgi:hypothetical protein